MLLVRAVYREYIFVSDPDSESEEEATSTDNLRLKRHSLSPLATTHRLNHKRGSGLLHHPLLAAVKEQDRSQIRRYSIATT